MPRKIKDPLLGGEKPTPKVAKDVKPMFGSGAPVAPKTPKVEKPVEEKATATPKTTVADIDKSEETKQILAKQAKVNFIIPVVPGEQAGAYDTVNINGYKLTIQKGVMVSIPLAVANLLAEKYRITMTAGESKRVDRKSDVADALNG